LWTETLQHFGNNLVRCHPVYDNDGGVKVKKDRRGHRVENAVKGGAFFAPFISTLDSIFNAPQSSGVEAQRSTAELQP